MIMKFYTIKLPKFLGGLVRVMLGSFKKGWCSICICLLQNDCAIKNKIHGNSILLYIKYEKHPLVGAFFISYRVFFEKKDTQ